MKSICHITSISRSWVAAVMNNIIFLLLNSASCVLSHQQMPWYNDVKSPDITFYPIIHPRLKVWVTFQNRQSSALQHVAGSATMLLARLGNSQNTHVIAAWNQYLPLAGASDLLHHQLQHYSMLSKHWGFAEVRSCQHSLTPVKDCIKQHEWSENDMLKSVPPQRELN